MNSSAEQNSLRRYRDLLIATSDDMLRNQLCRLIAKQERQALLQQISEQQSPANPLPGHLPSQNDVGRRSATQLPNRSSERHPLLDGLPGGA